MSKSLAPLTPLEDTGAEISLSDLAYERLLDLMLSGELPGGTPLQERKLALRLNISRTPMREALARLESRGLVERHLNRYLIVRRLSLREFVEVLNVRKLLESEAAALAAVRVPLTEIAAARQQIAAIQANPDAQNGRGWTIDEALHAMVGNHCGNEILAETALELRQRTHMFETRSVPGRLHDSCAEHLALLQALENRDPVAARRLMAEHIENVKTSTIEKLTGP